MSRAELTIINETISTMCTYKYKRGNVTWNVGLNRLGDRKQIGRLQRLECKTVQSRPRVGFPWALVLSPRNVDSSRLLGLRVLCKYCTIDHNDYGTMGKRIVRGRAVRRSFWSVTRALRTSTNVLCKTFSVSIQRNIVCLR